jgi:hypothetical protein
MRRSLLLRKTAAGTNAKRGRNEEAACRKSGAKVFEGRNANLHGRFALWQQNIRPHFVESKEKFAGIKN